jgi:hypothetical protein
VPCGRVRFYSENGVETVRSLKTWNPPTRPHSVDIPNDHKKKILEFLLFVSPVCRIICSITWHCKISTSFLFNAIL